MRKFRVTTHSDDPEAPLTCQSAARLARVSVAFVQRCERADLVQPKGKVRGQKGYSRETVQNLKRIRHLHVDLGLDLDAVDFILRMHKQMSALQSHIADMEQRMLRRERELLGQIQELRMRLR